MTVERGKDFLAEELKQKTPAITEDPVVGRLMKDLSYWQVAWIDVTILVEELLHNASHTESRTDLLAANEKAVMGYSKKVEARSLKWLNETTS